MYLTSIPRKIPMDAKMEESLQEARINVLLASPMIGYQMHCCDVYYTDHPQIRTAAACVTEDANLIMINSEFWHNFLENKAQRAFVLLHEVLHIFLKHGERLKDMNYDDGLWGEATDFNINLTAAGYYVGEKGELARSTRYPLYLEMPKELLFNKEFNGLSSDEIYKILQEEQKKSESDKGNPSDESGCGNPGSGDGDSFDGVYVVPGDTSKQDMKNTQSAIESVIHAKNSSGIGDNEGNLARMFREFAEPKFSYIDYLTDVVVQIAQDDPTYNKISKRNCGDIIFPSYEGSHINLTFAVDTSGSMGIDDYKRAVGEIRGLLDDLDSWTIHFLSVDTQCHLMGIYSKDMGDDFESISFKFMGGGGTELTPAVEYTKEQNELGADIAALIIITDGGLYPDVIDSAFDPHIVNIVVVTEGGNSNLQLKNARVLYA